ncbi:filamentous hemagglutinin N-terminal domain-containing protein [Trichothermofontia sichuanensis B231]|uniref:two-partner secretion domain-containing protein n=1 Tax=Trichothermofontia sichuanensis TaxID=3045816 RepID=UPI0022454591|nr:filamentous hemagglutinin N-terminal domain-containing protein [Trichothermofontia sichuanensis]UZQ53024.1 filamentous hemagglutinin N-terminal domain-containing protein [Trichothermofontia sichuanensis B231]
MSYPRLITCLGSSLTIAVGLLLPLLTAGPTTAQVIPDGSLATQVKTSDGRAFTITGGDRAGGNLFHSFREFSVPTGGEVFFDQALDVQTIVARVTGGQRSTIDGLLRANGSADLFLLNPAGILFGPNAALNLGGSFIASTAEAIQFGDRTEFSAVQPHTTPLLTISSPIGLQFGRHPGEIRNQSRTFGATNIEGLQGQSDRTLALVGGPLVLAGGYMTLLGGRAELGSVGANSTVQLTPIAQGWTLGYDAVRTFEDITLTHQATVNASSNQTPGEIRLRGQTLTLTGDSQLAAVTETGQGGTISLEGDRLVINGGSQVLALTVGSGTGGNLNVAAKTVELAGALLLADDRVQSSGLFASVQPRTSRGTGNGGNLNIRADRLIIRDGAQAAVTTFDMGTAGNLTVQARDVLLDGFQVRNNDVPIPSGLFAGTDLHSTGQGGNLLIETNHLTIRNGAEAQASTLGQGDAGNLTVRASESITLSGRTPDGQFPSALLAVAGLAGVSTAAEGRGGDLQVEAGRLSLQDGAEITVSATERSRGAGNLTISAPQIELRNRSALRAETAAGDRGNLTITSQDLRLRQGSHLTVNATGTATGGNIRITTATLAALENSDITANAVANFAGRVEITAQGIFGTAARSQLTPASDITASSDLGPQFSGVVEIQTPEVDPSQGLVALPSRVIDIESLVARACEPRPETERSEFIVTGRGGLPASPTQALSPEATIAGWVSMADAQGKVSHSVPRQAPPRDAAPKSRQGGLASPLVEAQGWVVNRQGQMMLVALPGAAFEAGGGHSGSVATGTSRLVPSGECGPKSASETGYLSPASAARSTPSPP